MGPATKAALIRAAQRGVDRVPIYVPRYAVWMFAEELYPFLQRWVASHVAGTPVESA